MTGFARKSGEFISGKKVFSWGYEIKSVNGKLLGVKINLPGWLESLALPMKNIAAKYFQRGSINVFLDISSENGSEEVNINKELLVKLADTAIELYESYGDKLQKPSTGELLSARGVIDDGNSKLSDEEKQALENVLLEGFEQACAALQQDRFAEGRKIRDVLLGIVDKIDDDVKKIIALAAEMPAKIKERLTQQIAELSGGDMPVNEERLAQEIVFFVNRADIKEETDRLEAHLKTARDLLNSQAAVGRRLDFLCQELNREANTTCSKSGSIEITNLGMELKTLIEQLREQVQNME